MLVKGEISFHLLMEYVDDGAPGSEMPCKGLRGSSCPMFIYWYSTFRRHVTLISAAYNLSRTMQKKPKY